MVAQPGSVLLLSADGALRASLIELLHSEHHATVASPETSDVPAAVIAAADSWPAGWSFERLCSTYAAVPCVVLSSSPLAGDFALWQLARGYFVRLPARPNELLALVNELRRG